MPVERSGTTSSLVDVLDRVLDKGIVIDAWVRVSLVGIDLRAIEARVLIASIETYLKYAETVGSFAVARRLGQADAKRLAAENEELRRRLDPPDPEGPAPVFARLKPRPGRLGGAALPPPPDPEPDVEPPQRRKTA